MTEEQLKMTIFLKAGIRKAAAEIVIQEVMLALFNSYEYIDSGEMISACFEAEELKIIHELFEKEYINYLHVFLSQDSKEQNRILDTYIEHRNKVSDLIHARDDPM